ncbi:MAG: glycosyltransferase family 2 protein [Acidimicrobiia bacterium]
MEPRVTVSIPTYNRPEMLRTAIISVLAQSMGDLEIVVCDNDSPIDVGDVVSDLGDDRVTLVRQVTNVGRWRNMTTALQSGTAPFVTMLMDDEELVGADSLAQRIEHVERTGADWAYSRFVFRDAAGRELESNGLLSESEPPPVQDGRDFIRMSFDTAVPTWVCSIVFRRDRIGGLRVLERDAPADDNGFILRAALGRRIGFVDERLVTLTGEPGESVADGYLELGSDGQLLPTPFGVYSIQRVLEEFAMTAPGYTTAERSELLRACRRSAVRQYLWSLEQGAGTAHGDTVLQRLRWLAVVQPRVLRAPKTLKLAAKALFRR